MNIPELLMPVGSPAVLPVALQYGADAVYLGSDALSLRAKADNFTDEALQEAIRYTQSLGKKLYLTVNIFAHEEDLKAARALFFDAERLDRPSGRFYCIGFRYFPACQYALSFGSCSYQYPDKQHQLGNLPLLVRTRGTACRGSQRTVADGTDSFEKAYS